MCKKCGHDCRGEQNKRMTAIAALLVMLAPAAAPAINGYLDTNTRTNNKMNEIDDAGREILDRDLDEFNKVENNFLRGVYDTVPLLDYEEALRQIQGVRKEIKDFAESFKAYVVQRYNEGDRTMSEHAQEGIREAEEYRANMDTAAGEIATAIIGALSGRKTVQRDPSNGSPIMPGSPAGVSS